MFGLEWIYKLTNEIYPIKFLLMIDNQIASTLKMVRVCHHLIQYRSSKQNSYLLIAFYPFPHIDQK